MKTQTLKTLTSGQKSVTYTFLYLLQTQEVTIAEQDGQLTINQD